MKKLCAFYFSGTGNTRYVTQALCEKLSESFKTSMCEIDKASHVPMRIRDSDLILLAFPIYGSSPPVPMRRFVHRYRQEWKDKEIVLVATQYFFSGDGAASLGRTLEKLGGCVRFAEHFNMPNNLADFSIWKIRNGSQLKRTLDKADRRIQIFADRILHDRPKRRGFDPVSHAVGYLSQRCWWRKKENEKTNFLKVDTQRCIGCGLCMKCCPVGNLRIVEGIACPQGDCALCYRCVNLCPKKALTLLGGYVPQTQYKGPVLAKEFDQSPQNRR